MRQLLLKSAVCITKSGILLQKCDKSNLKVRNVLQYAKAFFYVAITDGFGLNQRNQTRVRGKMVGGLRCWSGDGGGGGGGRG